MSNQGADLFTLAGRSNITAWKASIFHVLIKWREKALEEIRRKEEKLNGASGISYVGATMSELCECYQSWRYARLIRRSDLSDV